MSYFGGYMVRGVALAFTGGAALTALLFGGGWALTYHRDVPSKPPPRPAVAIPSTKPVAAPTPQPIAADPGYDPEANTAGDPPESAADAAADAMANAAPRPVAAANEVSRTSGPDEVHIPAAALALIQGQLREPESARYRNVSLHEGENGVVVCGEINSRNGFGGYTGFQRFFLNGHDLETDPGGGVSGSFFRSGYMKLCGDYPF